jgi:hypothetical protein
MFDGLLHARQTISARDSLVLHCATQGHFTLPQKYRILRPLMLENEESTSRLPHAATLSTFSYSKQTPR